MPGESGQDLPQSPQEENMSQERNPGGNSDPVDRLARGVRGIAKRFLGPGTSRQEENTTPPSSESASVNAGESSGNTTEQQEVREHESWLFTDESELQGLDPSIHVALRHAERIKYRNDRMAADTLSRVYQQIDEAVLGGKVEPEKVLDYQAKIAERIEELDKQNAPQPSVSEPQAPPAVQIDTAPIAEAIAAGQREISRAQEALRETMERQGDEFRRVAESVRDREAPPVDVTPIVEAIATGQREMSRAQETSAENVNRFTEQMGERISQMVEHLREGTANPAVENAQVAQTQALMEMLGGEPSKMRERWAQAEYRQDFWMRFNPGQEPRFYTNMDYEGRATFDARWRLARAATAARALSGRAEDYVTKNQELGLITEEEMRRMYELRGVRPALEWYTDFICNNKTVEVNRGGRRTPITIWECRNDSEFQQIRRAMREQALGALSGGEDITDFGGGVREELDKYEADAVAWNLITVTNLLESMDSRYSRSGARHDSISGELLSDDVRALLHPQEKWESKMSSKVGWGILSGWGITQVDRAKKEANEERGDDVRFVTARKKGEYWSYSTRPKPDGKKTITIKAPECFPTTTGNSYLERWKVKGETLLDKLLKKEEIDWNEVDSGTWNRYLFVNLYQALKLLKYWNPGVPFEMGKPGYAANWPGDLQEALSRTGMERQLSKGEIHNLKTWAVFGNLGVTAVNNKIPVPHVPGMALSNLEVAFREPHIGYLENGGMLGYRGEKLQLEDLN